MSRSELFLHICELAGPAVVPMRAGDGWPGIARVAGTDGTRRVALHVSQVGSHSRAPYERRFQNPAGGELVIAPRGTIPILVGLAHDNGRPILVITEGASRVGRAARFSILFNVSAIQQAGLTGWGEYNSGSGESIVAMHPHLLPTYIEALKAGVTIDPFAVGDVATAAGLLEEQDDETAERTRTIVSRLVRRAAFGRDVCRAYRQRCALCGIGLNLPEGAHIYPATAPGSLDKVWNGVALCRNHHRMFDLHRIWIDPDTKNVRWHPDVIAKSVAEPIVANFVENTFPTLSLPTAATQKPRVEMFTQRYEVASASYDWVN